MLSHASLVELHDAVLRLKIDRTALLVGIQPQFVATLPSFSTTSEQFLSDLGELNRVRRLDDGTTPLRIWLANGNALAGSRLESEVFRRHLGAIDASSGSIPAEHKKIGTSPDIERAMAASEGTRQLSFDYDVALSFAGEDRGHAESLAAILGTNGVRVFYDRHEQANLWGKDLYQHFQSIYRDKARFCVVFISQAYANKHWTRHELRQAQARALLENSEYILPIRVDDTEVPGLNFTTSYIDIRRIPISEVAALLLQKLNLALHAKTTSPRGTFSQQSPKERVVHAVSTASPEVWKFLRSGPGSSSSWRQTETAEHLAEFSGREIGAGVAIARQWGDASKQWEDKLIRMIRKDADVSVDEAARLIRACASRGLLTEADDLDYRTMGQQAWRRAPLLDILLRAARRGGGFASLPPPVPERLSELLRCTYPVLLTGSRWWAIRYAEPQNGYLIMVMREKPARSWKFKSSDDPAPVTNEYFGSPGTVLSVKWPEWHMVSWEFETFDNITLQG